MSRTERAVIVWKPQPRQLEFMRRPEPVSYTHLTLPTIYSV